MCIRHFKRHLPSEQCLWQKAFKETIITEKVKGCRTAVPVRESENLLRCCNNGKHSAYLNSRAICDFQMLWFKPYPSKKKIFALRKSIGIKVSDFHTAPAVMDYILSSELEPVLKTNNRLTITRKYGCLFIHYKVWYSLTLVDWFRSQDV